MLFTGLLFGGASGAIASADPDAGNSAAKTQTQAANPASTATGTTANNPNNLLRKTVQQALLGVTRTLNSLAKPAQQPVTATDSTTAAGSNASGTTTAAPTTAVPTPAVSNSVASNSNDGAPAADPVAPLSSVSSVSPVSPVSPAAPVSPVTPLSKVVGPITNAVTTVASSVESVPGMVLSLPTSATPVADVITTVQNVLTSVTDAVIPLTQLPSDLASLLGVTPINQPVLGSSVLATGPIAAVIVPAPASPLPQAVPIPGTWDVPLAPSVAAPVALGGIATAGLSQELSTSGMAPPAPASVSPPDVLSILKHTVGALLVPASLSALAAVALPGVGGLLIICAAGMRVGYRQAKAGWALQITGIARYAGPGPLGVVRSGTLVALRPRALRVARPEVSRAAGLLDQAAA